MFGSPKAEKFTLHQRRAEFLVELAEALGGQVDVFGKGHRWVEHKAEGIDAYRYHIAVENHIGPHHWTEKLSDAFLGFALPFYVGCSNAADYFPEDSFIALDIRDTQAAVARIRKAVADNEYERRLPAIIEARRRFGRLQSRQYGRAAYSGRARGHSAACLAGRCQKSRSHFKPPCHNAAGSQRVFALCAGQARGAASGAALLC